MWSAGSHAGGVLFASVQAMVEADSVRKIRARSNLSRDLSLSMCTSAGDYVESRQEGQAGRKMRNAEMRNGKCEMREAHVRRDSLFSTIRDPKSALRISHFAFLFRAPNKRGVDPWSIMTGPTFIGSGVRIRFTFVDSGPVTWGGRILSWRIRISRGPLCLEPLLEATR
jgi:hypothetical protein